MKGKKYPMLKILKNLISNKIKIVFFVRSGLDSFLDNIINKLSEEYETKKIIVTSSIQIDEGMKWADICWFEWCDELIIYGSKTDIAKEKKIICRLHSYETFTRYPSLVNWDTVDHLIFVAEHIKDNVVKKYNINDEKIVIIPNGIDMSMYSFKDRKPSFNIAYVGYINYKKGPMLLLHTFKGIYDKDNRYKLYIAGAFQDERYILYFKQMIIQMGLCNNVFFEGWENNISQWLEDKDYIICTSVLESQFVGLMEAMARGIKPIIHNFVGATEIYPKKYVWNTIDEAVKMITEADYNSAEYTDYINYNYSLDIQIEKIKNIITLDK